MLGKVRGKKDATHPKCLYFVAVGGLSESQVLVLQIEPIKYQFDPRLMGTGKAKLLACDSIDINTSGTSLAWMITQMRIHRKVFCQILYIDKFLIFRVTDSRTHWKGKRMFWH